MTRLLYCLMLLTMLACAREPSAAMHLRASTLDTLHRTGEASINSDAEGFAFACTALPDTLSCSTKAGALSPAITEQLVAQLGLPQPVTGTEFTVRGTRASGSWTATIDLGRGHEAIPVRN